MRITNSMMVNNMIANITKNQGRMDKLQTQLATGKKIALPSDDPVVAARALKLRTDVSENEQYQKNVKDASSWLDTTETALSNINDVLKRVYELAVKTSNGSLSQDDMEATEKEVKQLKSQLVELGNSTYAGRYVFSGYKTDQKLLNEDGTYKIELNCVSDGGTPPTYTSTSKEDIKYEIGVGSDINVNVLGNELFDTSATEAKSNNKPAMMTMMDNFITDLENNDHTAISSLISNIQTQQKNVTMIRADVGARTNRLDLTSNRLDTDNYNFTSLMSKNEDADVAEVIMNLKNEENVYEASLSAGARIIQPTLVEFLK